MYAYIRFVADAEEAQKAFKVLNRRNYAEGASWRHYKDIRMDREPQTAYAHQLRKQAIQLGNPSAVVNTLKLSFKNLT